MGNQARVWWPLILYFFLTLAIAAFVIFFVDQNSFSTSRKPSVRQADGSVAFMGFTFLQSDVTTLVSFSLIVLRIVGLLSVKRTTWQCVHFLMRKREGISLGLIKWILGFGLPTRSQGTQRAALAIVAAILLTVLPSKFSSPILTGSISWDPSTYSVLGIKPVTGIPLATHGVAWTSYHKDDGAVNVVIQRAAGLASMAWGNTNSTPESMARVLPMLRHDLASGSELANVTVPYFAIDGLEWVQDVAANVTRAQIDLVRNYRSNFIYFIKAAGPTFALIPNNSQISAMDNLTFPHPSIQSDTSILGVCVDNLPLNATCTHSTAYCGEISPKIDLYPIRSPNSTYCVAFARVTYHAGAAVCHRCRLSNPFVFSNTTVLELQEDVMTTPALELMPIVSHAMVFANFSLPSPINNIDNFVTLGLSRSYQASWTALHENFGLPSTSLSTGVTIAVPCSRANVEKWRAIVWMVISIMCTLSCLISFIAIREPVITDIEIASMLLETDQTIQTHPQRLGDLSIVTKENRNLRLRLKYDNDHRVLTVIDDLNLPPEQRPLVKLS